MGRLDAFDEHTDDWNHYAERMTFYFAANGIKDDGKKRAIFLSAVGAKTYKLLRSLVASSKHGDKSFQALCDVLIKHLNLRPSVTLQQLWFNSRVRQSGESISVFVSLLWELSKCCEFGKSLEYMLRDRLVCGVADERIQRRLLAKRDLSFGRAWDIARAMEDANKNTEEIQGGYSNAVSLPTTAKVQYVQKRQKNSPPCYRCGESGHSSASCRFKHAKVFFLQETGARS